MLLTVMARHRRSENDPLSLAPATVEELAALERARPPLSIKRHAIVAGSVAGLLLAGATVWALAGTGDRGPGAPEGLGPGGLASAGAVDGFGLASPLASRSPSARPGVRPSPTAAASAEPPPMILEATATPASPRQATGVEASYVMLTWQGGYQVTFVVHNPTSSPVLWKLRLELPGNARYDHHWSAELAREAATLTFTPPRWDNNNPRALAPGTTHTFGFIVMQPSGDYRLVSCAVDGTPCRGLTA